MGYERGSSPLHDMIKKAQAQGNAALVVSNPKREWSCFRFDADAAAFPIIAVGAAAGHALKTALAGAQIAVQDRRDHEMVKTFATLLLCWLVPNVQWVLRSSASESTL